MILLLSSLIFAGDFQPLPPRKMRMEIQENQQLRIRAEKAQKARIEKAREAVKAKR